MNGSCTAWPIATGRNGPLNMALDPHGSYVFWTENNTGSVLQVPVGGGTVVTLKGPDSGNSAWAVVSDGSWVFWTDRVRGQINANTIGGGTPWNLATSPNGASAGTYGIAIGNVGGGDFLYGADFTGNLVWYIAATGKNGTGTSVGWPSAAMTAPTGLFFYQPATALLDVLYNTGTATVNGTFVASGTNDDSRYVTTDGTSVYWTASDGNQVWVAPYNTTGAGSAPTPLSSTESQPWGIAVDGANSVYWVNKTNGTIRHASQSGGSWVFATLATGNSPSDIRVDSAAIYWTDTGSGQVMRLNK
jgi:hypothetical protein